MLHSPPGPERASTKSVFRQSRWVLVQGLMKPTPLLFTKDE
jgi:hypothetical protein